MTRDGAGVTDDQDQLEEGQEPAPVPDWAPERLFPGSTIRQYVPVTVQDPGQENPAEVLVPIKDGQSQEEIVQSGLAYLQARRRVLKAWTAADLSEEWRKKLRDVTISTAANYIALQIIQIIPERFGEKGLQALYGPEVEAMAAMELDALTTLGDRAEGWTLDSEEVQANLSEADKAKLADFDSRMETTLDRLVDTAAGRIERLLRDRSGLAAALDEAVSSMEYEAVTAVLLDFEEEYGDAILDMSQEEYDRLFEAMLGDAYGVRRGGLGERLVQDLARLTLEGLEAGSLPLDKLLTLIGVTTTEAAAAPPDYSTLQAIARVSTDYGTKALVEWAAGRTQPGPLDDDGYRALQAESPRGQVRRLRVKENLPPGIAEIINPEDVTPALQRIEAEKNIEKAKTLLAAISCATQSSVDPESFTVRIDDLMRLVYGYTRSGDNKTRSDYWHKGVAALVKHLLLDLPSIQVHAQVTFPHEKEPLFANDWLMNRPKLYTSQPLLLDVFTPLTAGTTPEDEKQLLEYVKALNPRHIQLGFPRAVLDSLGALKRETGKPALDEVTADVMSLKGTAFWLAFRVAFLRRWAGKKVAPKSGTPLLTTLEEVGYLDAATRGTRRLSYKDALRAWEKDLDTLQDLGMLDHPGAIVYQEKAGRWHTVNSTIKSWLHGPTARGVRVNRQKLEGLTVLYQLSEERVKELEPLRKRQAGHQRRAAANKARAAAKKSG